MFSIVSQSPSVSSSSFISTLTEGIPPQLSLVQYSSDCLSLKFPSETPTKQTRRLSTEQHNSEQCVAVPQRPTLQQKLRSILIFKPEEPANSYWVCHRPCGAGIHHEWRNNRIRFVHVPDPENPKKSFVSVVLADEMQRSGGNQSEAFVWPYSFDVDLVVILDHDSPLTERNASLIRFCSIPETLHLFRTEVHSLVCTFLDPGIDAAVIELVGTEFNGAPSVSFFSTGGVEATLISILLTTGMFTASAETLPPAKGNLTFNAGSNADIPSYTSENYQSTAKSYSGRQPGNSTALVLPLRCLLGSCLFLSLNSAKPLILDALAPVIAIF